MASALSWSGPQLELLLQWFLPRCERLGQIIEDKAPYSQGGLRFQIMTMLGSILHPEFEHLWLGTYQESHKVRLDLLYRLGLPRLVGQSQTPGVPVYDPYGLGCDWGIVKTGFPTLLEECRLDYLFTKKHLPQGRAWIPDWLEYAVPRRAFGLGEHPGDPSTDSFESNETNTSWFPVPIQAQSSTLPADTMGNVSTRRPEWPPREAEYLDPQQLSLLAGHMEDNCRKTRSAGAASLDWPSREADYFDGHAAYEPARPQAAKSFLRHLARTFTGPNTHDPVRGVHTVRQMCTAAINAAKRQQVGKREETKPCPLVDTIIYVNLMFAVEEVGYGGLGMDAQADARNRFARLGIGEWSPQPEPEAGGSEADGNCCTLPETAEQIWCSLLQLLPFD